MWASPLSTCKSAPVINDALSEAKNNADFAISFSVVMRTSGVHADTCSKIRVKLASPKLNFPQFDKRQCTRGVLTPISLFWKMVH
jgi:hypothetical protein